MVEIDTEACNNCGICAEICPNFVFARRNDVTPEIIVAANQDLCCKCGHCVLYCPQRAVKHEIISEGDISQGRGSTIYPADVEDLMMKRRSIRSFKSDLLPKDQIERLIEVGLNAGSASNLQSESILVVQDRELLSRLEEMSIDILWNKGLKYATDRSLIGRWLSMRYPPELFSNFQRYHNIIERRRSAKQLEGMIFRKAPCLILLCGFKVEFLSPVNCALAMRNMELLAAVNGLGTCWAGLFITAARLGPKEINAVLQIDDSRQVHGALMTGYPKFQASRVVCRKSREVRWL